MLIKASPLLYSRQPHNYVEKKATPELCFPLADGTLSQRDFNNDQDAIMKIEEDQLLPKEYFLQYHGFQPENDPTLSFKEGARLHPVEIVMDKHVLEEMVEHSRQVCGVDKSTGLQRPTNENLMETGGALAGYLKNDQHGRVWVHITKSFHQDPEVIGARDRVVFDINAQGNWLTRIHEEHLIHFGFWHSHPTYSPFQSDERFWGRGADVQATQLTCKAWWTLAMVIDPFPSEVEQGIDAVEIGAYKMVTPGAELSDLGEEEWTMGWRSASILVKGGRSIE